MYGQLSAIVIVDDDDREKACLLFAHLASLLDGAEPGHLDEMSLLALTDAFREALQDAGFLDDDGEATGKPLRAEVLWNAFKHAASSTADRIHPLTSRPFALSDTRDPDADYGAAQLVSLSRLEFQDAVVRAGAKIRRKPDFTAVTAPDIARQAPRRQTLAEIVECLKAGLTAQAGLFLKGNEDWDIWIAPIEDRVADLLLETDRDGIAQRALDELRDLLGLWMENGWSDRPLAAFHLACPSGLRAPNVITASGYPRFRHRPAAATVAAPTAGLTFNLDSRRSPRHPGSGEVVARGIRLGQVTNVAMAGQPCSLTKDPKEQLTLHQEYAESAGRGRTWGQLLVALEALL